MLHAQYAKNFAIRFASNLISEVIAAFPNAETVHATLRDLIAKSPPLPGGSRRGTPSLLSHLSTDKNEPSSR